MENHFIVLGCSGGPDSMCLLELFLELNLKVICAHVNHNIRPESKEEAHFIEEYCRERKIPFELLELDSSHENESYYRRKRYTFYKDIADRYDTPYIATAHHGDDLIETVLMRIARGSHIRGYLGFKKLQKEGKYRFIKPLIFYTKEDVLSYLKDKNVPYVTDLSNESDDYTRNRYRHHVLPYLKKESKDIQLKYLKYSEELESICEYLDKVVGSAMDGNYKNRRIDLTKFKTLDPLIQRKELETIFSKIYKDDVDKLCSFHIDDLLDNLLKEKNFKYSLPCGLLALKEYDNLTFTKEECTEPYDIELTESTFLPNGDKIEKLATSEDCSNFCLRLNSCDITLPLYIKTRRHGDKIQSKNLGGAQKLKSIFIDAKIEPSKRDTWPIVTDAKGTILWIPGIKKSKFDVNKDGKYDIILKYIQRKENIDEKK